MRLEVADSGRLPLSSFYGESSLSIHEHAGYLRALGTTEGEGSRENLLISNYMTSPSRCMPFSSFFNVCCHDECEDLMSQVEGSIRSPSATPDHIIDVISALKSSTVGAPRVITPLLHSRLNDIAARHGGQVPLHGRLFMQWMHYNFPRECSFPQLSGTTNPMTQDEWLYENPERMNVVITPEEREVFPPRHIN